MYRMYTWQGVHAGPKSAGRQADPNSAGRQAIRQALALKTSEECFAQMQESGCVCAGFIPCHVYVYMACRLYWRWRWADDGGDGDKKK